MSALQPASSATKAEASQEAASAYLQNTLLNILSEYIHDNRFLRLIRYMLQAGYLEEWSWHETLSGAPQGGVFTPPTK